MSSKHNAGIVILLARVKVLEKTLENFYENFNSKYDYPIYLHTFGKLTNDGYLENLRKKFSENIFLKEIDYEIPKQVDEKELFYNRSYNRYVKKNFPKKRIGYLHMLRFSTNLTSFGKIGCMCKDMEKYEKLMKFDDESWFKKKINFDLFDILNEYPTASAYADGDNVSIQTRRETTENLWNFYKYYLKKYNYEPLCPKLKNALKNNDEDIVNTLIFKCGNMELYNIDMIKKSPWNEYIEEVNQYAGDYKYRWGDNEVIGLFFLTHFEKPFFDFKLKQKGIYFPSIPSEYTEGYAPSPNSILNIHSKNFILSNIYRLILTIKKKLFPFR